MSKDLIDELVHQFTDPFAAYRELIQNSIDAGSTRIEVVLAYRPGKGAGQMTATVQDWGEGMNRKVIEDYLLTKFRSSKENDLTKIGKYGIGFMSVFALQPDAVTVDTGKDLESWRVLFKTDRTYELLKNPEPFEGTRVTLHRRLKPAEFDEHVEKTKKALTRWCRHSEVDVTFAAGGADGSPPANPVSVHEPVTVYAPFQVEHKEEGLHVVVGPSGVDPFISGFYNRGLTLLETAEPLIPGVVLKVVSRHLEHTLTRDDVKRDEGFYRAMAVAQKLVDGPLRERLPDELKRTAEHPVTGLFWQQLFEYARTRVPRSQLWLRAPDGGAQSAKGVRKELVVSATPTPVALRLVKSGTVVVEADDALAAKLKETLGVDRVVRADEAFTFAEPPTTAQPIAFAAALTQLLAEAGCAVEGVALAELRGAAAAASHVFIEALGRPQRTDGVSDQRLARKKKHGTLCLNRTHVAVQRAAALMERAPRLAALLFARQLLVGAALLDAKTDALLTGWALA